VGGALFLFWYGLKSLLSALRGSSLSPADSPRASRYSVILSTLAVSLLNPHVYLDTIIMLGSISGGFEGRSRFVFALGACCSSFIWFFTLSLGGTLLEPLFRKPLSWRILDLSMCLVMWSIACSIWPSPK
jgi:L-lysine exporter family protein LysE/ArgO